MSYTQDRELKVRKIILRSERACAKFKELAEPLGIEAVADHWGISVSAVEAIAAGKTTVKRLGDVEVEVIADSLHRGKRYKRLVRRFSQRGTAKRLGMADGTVNKILQQHSMAGGRSLRRPRSPSNPVTQFLTRPVERRCEPA